MSLGVWYVFASEAEFTFEVSEWQDSKRTTQPSTAVPSLKWSAT